MLTGNFHPIPRVIVGIIALVIGVVIHQPVLDIVGAVLLIFAGFQIVHTRGTGGGFRR
jgi:threonine/homoserine/homoserine lactone efflux protein